MFLADSVLRIAWAIAAFAFSLCVISYSAWKGEEKKNEHNSSSNSK
jgi:hypothetical protein